MTIRLSVRGLCEHLWWTQQEPICKLQVQAGDVAIAARHRRPNASEPGGFHGNCQGPYLTSLIALQAGDVTLAAGRGRHGASRPGGRRASSAASQRDAGRPASGHSAQTGGGGCGGQGGPKQLRSPGARGAGCAGGAGAGLRPGGLGPGCFCQVRPGQRAPAPPSCSQVRMLVLLPPFCAS